ncbi:MAG: hypothetical protein HQM12_14705 [SAR324 cluster bacterium]|nr:hypothetical protein [SAR324 cluster bacterium]
MNARVIKLDRTLVLVHNHEDHRPWKIRYGTINLEQVDTTIHAKNYKALDCTRLKVGDLVGFKDRQNQDKYGTVTRLNQKTASFWSEKKNTGAWPIPFCLK